MAVNGNDILIYKDGVLIAGMTSSEVQTNAELLEVASPSSGLWKNYIVKRKDWTVTVNYLMLAEADVTSSLNVGATYSLRIRGRHRPSSSGVYGQAILKTCKITATRGNLVQGSFQFVGIEEP